MIITIYYYVNDDKDEDDGSDDDGQKEEPSRSLIESQVSISDHTIMAKDTDTPGRMIR